MAGITKTKWAVRLSIGTLLADGPWAYLWTFTTEDKIELPVLADRWNQFRRWFQRTGGRCVRVFEPHPGGHGWHVHFLTNGRWDVNEVRLKAEAAGFGRIHVKRVPRARADYIAKYVGKRLRNGGSPLGARMWACVGFEGTSAKHVRITTRRLWAHFENGHAEWKPWPPHFDDTRWVVGPDRRMRLERIWIFPPWSRELEAEVRACPLGVWSERRLMRWGFKKAGDSAESSEKSCGMSQPDASKHDDLFICSFCRCFSSERPENMNIYL